MRGPTERRRDAGRAESAPSVTRRDPGREELPAPAWQPQRITQAFTFPERRETIGRYATTTSHDTHKQLLRGPPEESGQSHGASAGARGSTLQWGWSPALSGPLHTAPTPASSMLAGNVRVTPRRAPSHGPRAPGPVPTRLLIRVPGWRSPL